MTIRRFSSLLCALALAACAATPSPLDREAQAILSSPPAAAGALIYTGSVVPEGYPEPAFRYERRSSRVGESWSSTHLTYPVGSSEPAVVQLALHSSSYELRRFDEVHAQTGSVSSVAVSPDGSLAFTLTRGDVTKDHLEGPGDPVVVGPTLFGFALAHWDELLLGRTIPVRFAATDQARSYAFELRLAQTDAQTTTISFDAASFFVRLAIARMEMVFDTESKRILRYVGRVPPRLAGLEVTDAHVEYRFVAAEYR